MLHLYLHKSADLQYKAPVCTGNKALQTKAAFTLGARVRFSLGTNVNTPFFQVPTPEFGHGEYKVETLYLGTKVGTNILGTQCLNTAPFCAGAQALVLGHQV